jgi:DNA mismatch repair protein MutS
MPNIIDTYLQYVSDSKKKYGERTMVFLECGAFYEIYDVVSPEHSAHLQCCQERLGLLVTRKNKADLTSPYMAGIPSHSIRRFNKTLLQHNYTIVFVTQHGEAPNITREVTKVLSPGCNLSEEVHESTDAGQSVLLALLIEEDADGECYAHLATFDANCGKTQLQTIDCNTDVTTASIMLTTLRDLFHTCIFDELCVHYRSPREAFLRELRSFTQFWKDSGKQVHEFDVSVHQMDYMFQRSFQAQFLERTFSTHKSGFCTIWESLHLQFTEPSCVAVLVMLLHWIQLHDKRLIASLQVPQSHQSSVVHRNDTTSATQLAHPTMRGFNELYAKLNIFDDKQQPDSVSKDTRSLFSLLNKTRTKMGERLLRDRFAYVATDRDTIQTRLDLVDALLNNTSSTTVPNDTFRFLHKYLRCIDLERIYRRFSVGNLQPHDIPRVLKSQQSVLEVLQHVSMLPADHPLSDILPDNSVIRAFEQYQAYLFKVFDADKCMSISMSNLFTTLFHVGQYPEIDSAVSQFEKQTDAMQILANALMARVPNIKLSKNTTTWIHAKSNDKDGYWLDVTKTRFQQLKQVLDTMTPDDKTQFAKDTNQLWTVDDLTFDTKNKTNVKIAGSKMRNLSHTIHHAQHKLIQLVKDTYATLLRDLHTMHYAQTIQPVVECIAQLDVAFSTATTATTFGYTRPTIVTGERSSVEAMALRHPLIERLLVQSGKCDPYIANDVRLSCDSCWLLYGVNSVGKSSLLKSIAIGVMMAQAGLFVPAKTFKLTPYHKIFARTGNDDNIHMAHSSFVNEIIEVRNIIESADARSMVIADELCASTELDSAVNIVAALLKQLTTRCTTYAFATHLFALQEHPYVQDLLGDGGSLHNLHLQVRFEDDKLVFDRTLTDGLPSNRTYGVLVADKVIKNDEFSSLLAQVMRTPCTTHTTHTTHTTRTTPSYSFIQTPFISNPYSSVRATTDGALSSVPYFTYHHVSASRYNRKHWNEECAVCEYRPLTERHQPLDTHHIHEQRTADKTSGLIDGRFHKNEKHNLVTLCKQCHRKIDTGELVVDGYKSTSDGPELIWYSREREPVC